MKPYAEFDRNNFPVITIYFTGEKETKENFEAYLGELGKNYDRKEAFSLIFELSKAPIPNLSYQLKQANWMKENEFLIQQYCRGVAYVIPSALLRNVLKFIFSIQRNPVPFKVFSSFEEGEEWVKGFGLKVYLIIKPLAKSTVISSFFVHIDSVVHVEN